MSSKSPDMVACPKCRTGNNTSRYHAGARIKCVRCGGVITVPGGKSAAAKPAEPEPEPSDEAGVDTGAETVPETGHPSSGARKGAKARPAAPPPSSGRRAGVGGRGAPPPPREKVTPLMRAALHAQPPGGVPMEPPSTRRGSGGRAKKRGEDNSAVLVTSIIAGLVVLGGIVAAMQGGGHKPAPAPTAGAPAVQPQPQPVAATPPQPQPGPTPPVPQPAKPPTPGSASPPGEDLKLVLTDEGEQMVGHYLDGVQSASTQQNENRRRNLKQFKNDAIPSLINALADMDDFKAVKAQDALAEITGKSFGWSPGLPVEERRKIQEQWKRWWLGGAAAPDVPAAAADDSRKHPPAGTDLAAGAPPVDPAFESELDKLLPGYDTPVFSERERIKGKVKGQGKGAVPALIKKLYSEDYEVAKGAGLVLDAITGESFGTPPKEEKAAEEFALRWATWWREHKDSFQMPE